MLHILDVCGGLYIQVKNNNQTLDLFALEKVGSCLLYSDSHFDHLRDLINPNRGIHMGNDWETKLRHASSFDWYILVLSKSGAIEKVEHT